MNPLTLTVEQILVNGGVADTNWGKRILRAHAFGSFALEDYDRANAWITCACGELDPRIPRYGGGEFKSDSLFHAMTGEPKDWKLAKLGTAFAYTVNPQKYLQTRKAARILVAIEKRSKQVLEDTLRSAQLRKWRNMYYVPSDALPVAPYRPPYLAKLPG